MDIEELERKEKMLKLRNELLAVEEDRLNGKKDIPLMKLLNP